MKLEDLLKEKRSPIIKKWLGLVIESYPPDAQRFFNKEKDRFANPVGSTIAQGIEKLYDAFIAGEGLEALHSCLDGIIRIRAVQAFTPSEAVGFVFGLKRILREVFEGVDVTKGTAGEFRDLEERIDGLGLMAFDSYTRCRQKLYDLRVNEVRAQVSRLLQRANLVCEIPELQPDLPEQNR
jgi:hypothetical protein